MAEREASEAPRTPESGPTSTEELGGQRVDDISVLLLTINEVFVYKVPPLRASSGYRAEEWGLESPVFTGSLKIYGNTTEEKCHICIYRPSKTMDNDLGDGNESRKLFCDCCVEAGKDKVLHQYVEGVQDSSRYFVLRIEDSSMKRVAYLGIGFRDRDTAFDFKASLDDFIKRSSRSRLAEHLRNASLDEGGGDEEDRESDASCLNRPTKDLSLSGNIKIHIPTPSGSAGKGRRHHRDTSTKNGEEGTGGMVLIPPPPSGGGTPQRDHDKEKDKDHVEKTSSTLAADIDSWGDFESA